MHVCIYTVKMHAQIHDTNPPTFLYFHQFLYTTSFTETHVWLVLLMRSAHFSFPSARRLWLTRKKIARPTSRMCSYRVTGGTHAHVHTNVLLRWPPIEKQTKETQYYRRVTKTQSRPSPSPRHLPQLRLFGRLRTELEVRKAYRNWHWLRLKGLEKKYTRCLSTFNESATELQTSVAAFVLHPCSVVWHHRSVRGNMHDFRQ